MTISQNTVGIITDRLGRTACTECGAELDVSEYTVFERIICPACEREQVVPAKLGNFLLQDLLGTGGMGAVYLAQDQTLRRKVALKVMRAQFGSDSKHYEDFRNEAQATARLNHPNIVQVYSLGDEKGQPYIVMELLDGDRLDELMDSGKKLSNVKILEVARDVAKGLDAASKAGVIHGDIKPGNILFDKRNLAKVVDFGLAKFMESGDDEAGNAEIWGTPFYIAPEKARKKGEDARSDQYSLGATLWHCLAGEAPFDGETPADVVLARFKNPPPSICPVREDISEKTDHILQRMMARKPEHRYPTYSSLLADIDEALEEARIIAHAPIYEGAKTPPWVKHAITLGGGVLLVGILAAVFTPKGDSEAKLTDSGDYVSVIRDGKRVKIPRTQGGVTDARSPSSPFSAIEEDHIIQSAGNFIQGRGFNADSQLTKAEEAYKPFTLQGHWLELLRSVNALMEGDSLAAGSLLRPLIIQSKPYSEYPVLGEDPRDLAKLLTGKLKPEAFLAKHTDSEPWYQDYGHLIVALVHARKAQPDKVVEHAELFFNTERIDPKWIYTFKPYAEKLAKEAREFKTLSTSANRGNARAIDTWAGSHSGLWGKALKQMSPTQSAKPAPPRPAVSKPAVSKPVVSKPAVRKPVQPVVPKKATVDITDRKKVEAYTARLLPQLVEEDFLKIFKGTAAPKLSTESGRGMLKDHQAAFEAAIEIRHVLATVVKGLPYKGSALESGAPIDAKFNALLFNKGGKKVALKIKAIPPLDFLRVISWYLNNGKNVTEMDQKLLGLSLYARHYKAPQYAEQVWSSIGSKYKEAHPYTYLLFE